MQLLTYEKQDAIGIIRVNRPAVLNVINLGVLQELEHFLEVAARQDNLKAVILTGTGEKAFIAGADIREISTMNQTQMFHFCALGQRVTDILETAPYLTIAAVNGYALGGGLELALGCDFIYASQNAQLGLPEVCLGLIPGFGGTQRLLRAIGARKAKELIMSGRSFSADIAHEMGIVNAVCEPASLMKRCLEVAKEITSHSFTAVIEAKQAINCGAELGLATALELERNMCVSCFDTNESRQAITKFLEKRKR